MEETKSNSGKTFDIRPNCGRTIIRVSNTLLVISIIFAVCASVGIGIGLGSLCNSTALGIISALVHLTFSIILIVFFIDYCIKGYGQLIENSAITASALSCLCELQNVTLRQSAIGDAEAVEDANTAENVTIKADGVYFHAQGSRITCPFCETEQRRGVTFCGNCGQAFHYDED
ncbi:MAG: hypothetical protein IIY70_00725 [Oscillospiraceae bacterium]|nr:hypothetical protein [Oscillospiraceae bacterium]